ncbi:MAG TPA: hypothetical protein VKS21_11405, partial [Spirochaetota bacterium]|nr:hypothetical protein [Spirochaetota bacterium]
MRKIILTVGSFFILLNIKIFAFQVVLVTADPMTSNDIHIETEISSLFGTPLYQYGNQDPTGNINSGDVVYITADADISMYASMYESLPNGIVVANSAALEMLYLCSTGDSGTDYGIMGTVQNSTHEICQGLSGTISLLNNSASRIICHPANDGQFLISTYSNTSNCVTAAFTQNALMAGGYTATGRRASFYFKTGTLSPDGITILSNVILWAAGSTGGSSSSINSSFPVNSSSSVFFSSTSTAGNSSSGGSDTQAPWLDIHNSVEMESGLDSLTNTFSLSGTVTDNSPVEWADLQFTTTVNGTNWISEYMPLSWDQSGFWEKTNINLDVPVGVYSLTIRLNAADIHGNENPFYASNILFVKETPPDTQPPTAAVTNPVPGAIIT